MHSFMLGTVHCRVGIVKKKSFGESTRRTYVSFPFTPIFRSRQFPCSIFRLKSSIYLTYARIGIAASPQVSNVCPIRLIFPPIRNMWWQASLLQSIIRLVRTLTKSLHGEACHQVRTVQNIHPSHVRLLLVGVWLR